MKTDTTAGVFVLKCKIFILYLYIKCWKADIDDSIHQFSSTFEQNLLLRFCCPSFGQKTGSVIILNTFYVCPESLSSYPYTHILFWMHLKLKPNCEKLIWLVNMKNQRLQMALKPCFLPTICKNKITALTFMYVYKSLKIFTHLRFMFFDRQVFKSIGFCTYEYSTYLLFYLHLEKKPFAIVVVVYPYHTQLYVRGTNQMSTFWSHV